LQALPFFGELYDTFVNAGPRPSSVTGTKYDEVSNAFWDAVHDVLAGQSTAADSLARLERTLQHIRGNEQW
jgi:trehalose/maltose transport system substrate-binding protein